MASQISYLLAWLVDTIDFKNVINNTLVQLFTSFVSNFYNKSISNFNFDFNASGSDEKAISKKSDGSNSSVTATANNGNEYEKSNLRQDDKKNWKK